MAQNSKGAYLNVLQDADGKDVYPITRADGVYMNDGTTAQAKCEALDSKINSTKSSLQTSFQAGVDGIYNAITAQGTTPASKSQGDVKNAIGTLATSKYNQGKNDVSLSVSGSYVNASNGKSARVDYKGQYYRNEGNNVGLAGDYFHATFPEGYYGSEGQAWAPEIRVPVGTMNSNGWYDQDQYNAHYNQGVTDADNRANSSSTNYKSGYNAGYGAGKGAAGNITLYAVGNCVSDALQGAGAFLVIPGALSALYSRADVTVCVRANPWKYGALNDRKDVPNQSFAFNGSNYTNDATASFSLGSGGLTLSAKMNGTTGYGSCIRIAAYLHN